jgi:hypothetical protein
MGEIVKIGWNREKSRFQSRFHDFNKTHALKQNVPPYASAVWRLLAVQMHNHAVFTRCRTCGFCLHTIKSGGQKSRAAEIKVKAIILNSNLIQIFSPYLLLFFVMLFWLFIHLKLLMFFNGMIASRRDFININ